MVADLCQGACAAAGAIHWSRSRAENLEGCGGLIHVALGLWLRGLLKLLLWIGGLLGVGHLGLCHLRLWCIVVGVGVRVECRLGRSDVVY